MCLAVPGKIIAIEGDTATVDYVAEQRTAKLLSDEYAVGDYCIVQGGIVAIKIDKDEAEEALKNYAENV